MPTSRRRRFPATARSIRAARAYTTTALRGGTVEATTIDDVRVVVSELATNAVQHARTTFEVAVRTEGHIRIDVTDQSPRLPILRPVPSSTATAGRGLHIIDALCDRWGVNVHDDYKCIWCEIDREHPENPPL